MMRMLWMMRMIAPGVADDHPVGVDHGHDLEDVVLAQGLRQVGLAGDVVQDAAHDEGAGGLARVDPARDEQVTMLMNKLCFL